MNVNPYTKVSYDTITETIPVVTTTYESKTKYVMKEEQVYEVNLTQEQVDVIVAICGNITGGGDTRLLTDSIWSGLQKHASRNGDKYSDKKYSFKDYFIVKESSYNESGYIVVKGY
jgi:hypothetical protein